MTGGGAHPRRLLAGTARRRNVYPMTDRDPADLTLDDWNAELDASNDAVDSGPNVPGEVVQARLRAALERMLSANPSPPP